MLSPDEDKQKGLTFVKKQFLPRTGITYVDLVELLKTQCINLNFPKGRALTVLESIRFSYRFLQTLVDTKSNDPKVKYAKLITFLESAQPIVPLLDAMLHPDPCHQHKTDWCLNTNDLRKWVYCYFEKIGKLIVLESGEGLQLPIEGKLFLADEGLSAQPIGSLQKDGTILNTNEDVVGYVSVTIGVLGKNNDILDLNRQFIGNVRPDRPVGANIPLGVAGPVIWTDC